MSIQCHVLLAGLFSGTKAVFYAKGHRSGRERSQSCVATYALALADYTLHRDSAFHLHALGLRRSPAATHSQLHTWPAWRLAGSRWLSGTNPRLTRITSLQLNTEHTHSPVAACGSSSHYLPIVGSLEWRHDLSPGLGQVPLATGMGWPRWQGDADDRSTMFVKTSRVMVRGAICSSTAATIATLQPHDVHAGHTLIMKKRASDCHALVFHAGCIDGARKLNVGLATLL